MPKHYQSHQNQYLIENLKKTFINFESMPENFKLIFIAIFITEQQKEEVTDLILNDNQLMEFIVTEKLAEFIDACFISNIFTASQKSEAYLQLKLQPNEVHGGYRCEVNISNICYERKNSPKKNSETEEAAELQRIYSADTDSDNELEQLSDDSHIFDIRSAQLEKLYISNKVQTILPLLKDIEPIRALEQANALLANDVNAENTREIRKISEGFFCHKLVLGPFGADPNLQISVGRELYNHLYESFKRESKNNIFFIDEKSDWKKTNLKNGYNDKKESVKGYVINEKNAQVGSVIIIGSTAFKVARGVKKYVESLKEKTNVTKLETNKEEINQLPITSISHYTPPKTISLFGKTINSRNSSGLDHRCTFDLGMKRPKEAVIQTLKEDNFSPMKKIKTITLFGKTIIVGSPTEKSDSLDVNKLIKTEQKDESLTP